MGFGGPTVDATSEHSIWPDKKGYHRNGVTLRVGSLSVRVSP